LNKYETAHNSKHTVAYVAYKTISKTDCPSKDSYSQLTSYLQAN